MLAAVAEARTMPVVTFTTDFGTGDGYVGAMKGVVLSLAPTATLVDITHDVPPYDVAAGAFALAQATPHFPPGSIHVAVVDPGVGGERAELVLEARGSFFIGPDNGLLSLAARGPRVAHEITAAGFRREPVSPTFHGRDVFAAAAGRLAAGASAKEAGPLLPAIVDLVTSWTEFALAAPPPDASTGDILHVDRFGNLVTSWEGDLLTPGQWRLRRRDGSGQPFLLTAGRTYGDVAPGELVVYVGSAGVIEIGVREGSAAAVTGLKRGAPVSLERVG
jgi:S-adenosyl-L-methionine hydrolase (adenosine-forming)